MVKEKAEDILKQMSKNEVFVFIIIGIVIFYFVIFKPLKKGAEAVGNAVENVSDTVGLTTSKSKQRTIKKYTEKQTQSNNEWSANYHKKAPIGSLLFNLANRKHIAKELHDSFSWLSGFDFQHAFSVFKAISTKAQLSQVVDIFSKMYKKDLLTYLSDSCKVGIVDNLKDDNRLSKFIDYAENLKDY